MACNAGCDCDTCFVSRLGESAGGSPLGVGMGTWVMDLGAPAQGSPCGAGVRSSIMDLGAPGAGSPCGADARVFARPDTSTFDPDRVETDGNDGECPD